MKIEYEPYFSVDGIRIAVGDRNPPIISVAPSRNDRRFYRWIFSVVVGPVRTAPDTSVIAFGRPTVGPLRIRPDGTDGRHEKRYSDEKPVDRQNGSPQNSNTTKFSPTNLAPQIYFSFPEDSRRKYVRDQPFTAVPVKQRVLGCPSYTSKLIELKYYLCLTFVRDITRAVSSEINSLKFVAAFLKRVSRQTS